MASTDLTTSITTPETFPIPLEHRHVSKWSDFAWFRSGVDLTIQAT